VLTAVPYEVMQYQLKDYVSGTAVWPWSTTETDYGFQFDAFTCSNPNCCTTITYELATDNTNGASPTLVSPTLYTWTENVASTKKILNIIDRNTIDLTGTVYYIYASNKDTVP
jgi:hypothetical protein